VKHRPIEVIAEEAPAVEEAPVDVEKRQPKRLREGPLLKRQLLEEVSLLESRQPRRAVG
jgi:hypothetical protein